MSIKIKLNGQTVGHAYCFADNYLISVRYDLPHIAKNSSKDHEMRFTNSTLEKSDSREALE